MNEKFDFQQAVMDQYVFNREVLERDGVDIDNMTEDQLHHYLKEFSIHLADEVFEFLRHLNWKMHKTNRVPINRPKVIEEIVDIFKFAFNMILFLNVSETEFRKAWSEKTFKVWRRWLDEKVRLESLLPEDSADRQVKIDVQPPPSGSSTGKG